MSGKPSIVLVHGFWGGAAHWRGVIVALAQSGFSGLHAVELPLTSLSSDAARVQQMLRQIDGPVVLAGHSYGGAVVTQAGDLPNVAALVYVAAFAPDEGESLGSITQVHLPEAADSLAPDSDGYLWLRQDKFHESFCQDLPPEDGLVMAVTQKAPLASVFGEAAGPPAWKAKPSWYQVSTADRMIAPENQERMAARMNARNILRLDASHASLASRPREVAALIAEAAEAQG